MIGHLEFHVSRAARDHYGFDQSLFSSNGQVVFANFMGARTFAASINAKRDLVNFPQTLVQASQINAMGLIDEMLHVLLERYRRDHAPNLFGQALQGLQSALGAGRLERALRVFCQQFPPLRVYQGEQSVEDYLMGNSLTPSGSRPNREIVLEEMLMLWLENANPAFSPFLELFDDAGLELETAYPEVIGHLQGFLGQQPGFAAAGSLSIWQILRLPALKHPDSLEAQLEFLLEYFGETLGEFRLRVLSGLDVIREEGRYFHRPVGPGVGGGAEGVRVQKLDAQMLEHEPEAFTADREWMPRLVLIAKNAFVWLDQLSKQHGREIRTLLDVPDQELDRLAASGVTGLWLIGLWERSHASREIKQRMGNKDAVASAYSLYDYAIAQDLGGDTAVENLRSRAWARGLRLASDMVPNHVGIDGKWVVEHPDWFVQLPYAPFPSYSFNSADLSQDSRVGIFLEDHYYDHSDAAVVFKRLERSSGETRYIYHGNDGTSLPWNDTAQLNYLNPEAREAVIQVILHVARNFPVIRFDAAMTLAKKHIQRLWFPEPGSGGGIASRAEHGLTRADFDAAIPIEFWREVVDRCALETPDTLLLAEAFWMMEGYFVRSLGMHRVYNSAFMNMLRDEKNAEYRAILKNTLEFEPEILKRFVNFMNNPDERTAVDQFGKGDKYFGVATLMATLPGLPMLGHGQIEGYTEKYGMEYRRAYYDEHPDQGLIDHHASQVFPLLKKRYLFSDTQNFVLYDFGDGHGVNESVYAYSNAVDTERALVVYNNAHHGVQGWVKSGMGGKQRVLGLAEALGVVGSGQHFVIWREQVSGLEFIRSSSELREHGLQFGLGGYGRLVMLDWRELHDSDGRYAQVAVMLAGHGVVSVEETARDLRFRPVREPWRELLAASLAFAKSANLSEQGPAGSGSAEVADKAPQTGQAAVWRPELAALGALEAKAKAFADALEDFSGRELNGKAFSKQLRAELTSLQVLLVDRQQSLNAGGFAIDKDLLTVCVVSRALAWFGGSADGQVALGLIDEFGLLRALESELASAGSSDAFGQARLARLFAALPELLLPALKTKAWTLDLTLMVRALLTSVTGAQTMNVHRFEGQTYFAQEPFDAALGTLPALAMVVAGTDPDRTAQMLLGVGERYLGLAGNLKSLAKSAGYQLEPMVLLRPGEA